MNKIEFINLRNKKKWQNLINYNEINPGQTWEYSKFEIAKYWDKYCIIEIDN